MGRPLILFLVNSETGGAMGIRARSFANRLEDDFRTHIAYRSTSRVRAIFEFFWLIVRLRPALAYVVDMGYSGVLAVGLYRLLGRLPIIVDTGDSIYELSRITGNRGRIGLFMTKLLEWFALSISDRIVVRSHPHQELLRGRSVRADVIPDGVDLKQFSPASEPDLRQRYGLEGFTVVGLLGSLIWNSRWQMCYGWELIEVIHALKDRPVKGLIIGDGSGLPELKAQCVARGIEDRIVFVGRVPYDDLPRYINLMDVGLSTQTNDMAGQVRTTGKLPLYLACGRLVLASEVGEAARVLPREMLVPYNGTKDTEYPGRLVSRLQSLLEDPRPLHRQQLSVSIAKAHFDYDTLATTLRRTLYDLLPGNTRNQEHEVSAVKEPAP